MRIDPLIVFSRTENHDKNEFRVAGANIAVKPDLDISKAYEPQNDG